ncbi:MAG TPA: transglutaminase-like domain-containing protein [Flavobacteriaceae bacterium]|nr:transglutaminase-like domain-containing protein [Flavobacteriaceae bacterium]
MTKLITPLFLLLTMACFSQGKSDPTSQEVQQAKTLKSEYAKEDIVVLSKELNIHFNHNRRDNLVEAFKETKVRLMNISQNSRIQYPVFYDMESEVGNFELKDRRGRSLDGFNSGFSDEYLNSDGIFHGDYRVKYTELIFPLQGTTYVVETEKKFNDIKYFVSEYLSGPYRILNGKITIHIPNWLDLNLIDFNFEELDIVQNSVNGKDEKILTYTFKNIPPQLQEESVPGPSYLYPHLLFNAKSFSNNGEKFSLFENVDDLYTWCNGLVKKVKVDKTAFAAKVAELTAGAQTDEEKIKNIYYWVQDNIRYIAFEDGIAGFQPDSPQNVFNKRYGDCKGMAFLMKSMLEVAGFDSRLVWIGTDRLAYDYSVPSLAINNHMICAVKLQDKLVFLDATENYNRFGIYAARIQNKQAMVQKGDGYEIMTIPQNTGILNSDKTVYHLKIKDGSISGSAQRIFQNESRKRFQNIYTSFGSGDQTKVLSKFLAYGNAGFSVDTIVPFDVENREEPLELNYHLKLGNALSEFEGTMYIDIDPVKNASSWIFKERKADYKFSMKEDKITEVQLEIPHGYKVGFLPKDFSLSNDLVEMAVSYEQVENKIIYRKKVHFKNRLIKKSDFETWNAAFDSLREKLSQQITFVKTQS